ncbi:hypothetical protein BV25DRAFT_1496730 [Artomyces pyxidatus]|uniref:Uncharacterized protein n=1 Tax=Artomyces pyxidatus TaxID=48021 RepID=A0ACB8TBE0_9AGAM|nr:hypothetical protein BV25DRAFT_1496730 [Artomyces pyxidatus]
MWSDTSDEVACDDTRRADQRWRKRQARRWHGARRTERGPERLGRAPIGCRGRGFLQGLCGEETQPPTTTRRRAAPSRRRQHQPPAYALLTAAAGDVPRPCRRIATTSVTDRDHHARSKPQGSHLFLHTNPFLKFSLSFALGALGVMLSNLPFPQWSVTVLNARLDFRSMFLASLFLLVVLFLAYLTNPSETSFRSYLTEQSFRHHLSRLDAPYDDHDHSDSEDSGVHYRSASPPSAFHFTSRASVALRTPRHAFHSFAFFTIAAVIPNPRPRTDLDGSQPKEAWFVGAFGRWWRGGLIDSSWPPSRTRSKCEEEEGWSSGILNVKALEPCDGLPFPTTTSPRGAPPKLRSRDRSTPRQLRTSSPPPLPKSVTLPLHTPRHPQSHVPPSSSSPSAHPQLPPPRAPPATYDTTPAIAELLRQIAATRTLNHELRSALAEHSATASATDAALTSELDGAREAKRSEDAVRGELKSRTKTLEEGRRVAEAGKREAERRLKVARAAKDDASARVRALCAEIELLEAQSRADEERVRRAGEEAQREEAESRAKLERRKREVQIAEEVVAALGARVKELEEVLEMEREAITVAREKAGALRHERGLSAPAEAWDPIVVTPVTESPQDILFQDPFPTPLEKDTGSSGSSRSREVSASPRPKPLNLVSISNLAYAGSTPAVAPDALARRAKGYAIFDDDIALLQSASTLATTTSTSSTAFSPFADDTADKADEALSKSFQSDGDAFLERDWRPSTGAVGEHPQQAAPEDTYDPFEVRPRVLDPMDAQRSAWLVRAYSDPPATLPVLEPAHPRTRRWWSSTSNATATVPEPSSAVPVATSISTKTSLNPAAKVFHVSSLPFDSLNPTTRTLPPPRAASPGFFSGLAMRAFAPSPAEREALRRALGGSTNTSLERLPSLSEVGSMPASPAEGPSRSWFQGLMPPRPGKMRFSPWGDGEDE